MAKQAGGGRIRVKRIPVAKADYMDKYLSKEHRAPCFKGWRLWAVFGLWASTKVKDVEYSSEYGKNHQRDHRFRRPPSKLFYAIGLGRPNLSQVVTTNVKAMSLL